MFGSACVWVPRVVSSRFRLWRVLGMMNCRGANVGDGGHHHLFSGQWIFGRGGLSRLGQILGSLLLLGLVVCEDAAVLGIVCAVGTMPGAVELAGAFLGFG